MTANNMTTGMSDYEEGTFTEEERELIGREAAKLKREFESERKKRRGNLSHNSAPHNSSFSRGGGGGKSGGSKYASHFVGGEVHSDPLAEETERSLVTLKDLDKQLQESMNKKQQSLKELTSVQEALRKNRNELRRAERDLHETSRKFDQDKGELSGLQQKKDTLRREMVEMEEKLGDAKRLYNNTLEMNTNEILSIIEERDQLKRKASESALGYIERLDFERQLGLAKDELFAEQRSSRMRIDALQEELEDALRKVDDVEMTNGELHNKISSVEKESRNKESTSGELADLLRHEIEDLKNSERKLYTDIHDRDRNIQELQHMLVEKEKEISYEHEERAKSIAEKNFELQSTRDSHDRALLAAEEKCQVDIAAAVGANDEKHEEERLQLIRKQEGKIAEIEAGHLGELESRDQECLYLKEKLRQQEEATRELGERLRLEAQEQVRSAVAREKTLWEEEHLRVMKRERNSWDDELTRTQARLNEAVEYEKEQTQSAHKTISALRREIEEIRSENKELHKEATNAMMTSREAVQNEYNEQMASLRLQLAEERDMEVSRLQREIVQSQDDLCNVRDELESAVNKIKAMESAYEHHEKTVVLEINDECKKVSQIVGIHPRKVNVDRYEKKARGVLSPNSSGGKPQRTPVTDSLANLRACMGELVPHVGGLRDSIDSLKLKLHQLKHEKEQELSCLRDHYEIEKEKELDNLREKLTKTHLQEMNEMQEVVNKETEIESQLRKNLKERESEIGEIKSGMIKWKEETASKLAKEVGYSLEKKLRGDYELSKEEFLNQQRMILRMEDQISRLKAEQAMGGSQSDSSHSVKLLRHLQDRVRQLKFENDRLKTSSSMY